MSRIKINFDNVGNPEVPIFVLAYRNGEKIGGIVPQSVILSDNLTDGSECSFTVHKYIDGVKTPYWDLIQDFMLMWVPEWDKWFEITLDIDESTETEKIVSGVSLGQAELSQIMLYTIEINTEDDIARDDYTAPSVLYNDLDHNASILHRIFEKAPHYQIAHVDSTIQSIQRTFSFDDVSIYEACQEIAEEMDCIFVFESSSNGDGSINRSVSVYDMMSNCLDCGNRDSFTGKCPECGSENILEGYGDDTTVFVDAEELASEISLETDTDAVKNCFKLESGDDLMNAAIRSVNPNGTDYIWYFSEAQKSMMSDALREKVDAYTALHDYYNSEYVTTFDSDIISAYNAVVQKYSSYNTDISEADETAIGYSGLMLNYFDAIDLDLFLTSSLMPSIDIGSDATTAEEQAALLTSSALSPIALSSTKYVSRTTVNSAVVSMAKLIIASSKYSVEVVSSEFNTDTLVWTGTLRLISYSNDDDSAVTNSLTITVNDNYEYYVKEKLEKQLHLSDTDDMSISGLFKKDYASFCEELQYYSLNRLVSFYDACQACIDILIEMSASESDSDLYSSLYTPYRNKLLALEQEISLREDEISAVEDFELAIEDATSIIHDALDMEAYFGEELWKEFAAFRRECKYTNDNYISDGLTNTELLQNASEFIGKASDELYKSAELQHTISTQLINLLAIDKFAPLVDHFETGNYIRVLVDDVVYKLRLLDYTIDFDNFSNISVEFSDVLEVASEISDIQSTLQKAASMTTTYDAVKQQASQGLSARSYLNNWVEKGLDITTVKIVNAANNQTQSWDEHGMVFQHFDDIMDRYSDEKLKIVNNCIAITKDDFETTEVAIGKIYYINPVDGTLTSDYGISGKLLIGKVIIGENLGIYNEQATLKFDVNGLTVTNDTNTLTIDPNSDSILTVRSGDDNVISFNTDGSANLTGNLNALTLSAGGKTGADVYADGLYISSDGSLYAGANNHVVINSDGTFDFGNGDIVYDGDGLTVSGAINATSLSTGSKTSASSTGTGIYIDSSGNMYAGAYNQTQIRADGTFNFGNGGIVYDGSSLQFGSAVDDYVTTITESTISTTNIVANNLIVQAANISGTLSVDHLSVSSISSALMSGTTVSSAINSADSTASSAYSLASAASTAASDAAKVATNYLSYDTSNGMTIGYNNYATNIKSDGMRIYFGSSTPSIAFLSRGVYGFIVDATASKAYSIGANTWTAVSIYASSFTVPRETTAQTDVTLTDYFNAGYRPYAVMRVTTTHACVHKISGFDVNPSAAEDPTGTPVITVYVSSQGYKGSGVTGGTCKVQILCIKSNSDASGNKVTITRDDDGSTSDSDDGGSSSSGTTTSLTLSQSGSGPIVTGMSLSDSTLTYTKSNPISLSKTTSSSTASSAVTGLSISSSTSGVTLNYTVSPVSSGGSTSASSVEIQRGFVSITPSAANTPTGVAVTFSSSFSGTPTVVVTPSTSVPGTSVLGVSAYSPSSTGVTIYLTRANTNSTGVYWVAVYE